MLSHLLSGTCLSGDGACTSFEVKSMSAACRGCSGRHVVEARASALQNKAQRCVASLWLLGLLGLLLSVLGSQSVLFVLLLQDCRKAQCQAATGSWIPLGSHLKEPRQIAQLQGEASQVMFAVL